MPKSWMWEDVDVELTDAVWATLSRYLMMRPEGGISAASAQVWTTAVDAMKKIALRTEGKKREMFKVFSLNLRLAPSTADV
jgi:hypothetical protein